MKHVFRRYVERKEQQLAEKRRQLELTRISSIIDQYLEAQDIEDPQSREAALSFLRARIQPLTQNKMPQASRRPEL